MYARTFMMVITITYAYHMSDLAYCMRQHLSNIIFVLLRISGWQRFCNLVKHLHYMFLQNGSASPKILLQLKAQKA